MIFLASWRPRSAKRTVVLGLSHVLVICVSLVKNRETSISPFIFTLHDTFPVTGTYDMEAVTFSSFAPCTCPAI
ncbi:hypothetical protein OBBRIDRAFT_788026 [Obba rivulosa]|uniref:Secreted protein n=1 Tax=Obba rivulosa TaxID=1052685 RepID=A0A8E2DUB3_9APHY|nr:hypothetical protein OBBRIDRAFT_788026 [Obba rivulosa]